MSDTMANIGTEEQLVYFEKGQTLTSSFSGRSRVGSSGDLYQTCDYSSIFLGLPAL
jgi:hypothetical protein